MTTTVHDIIEDFRMLPVSARERGERFEQLMAQYLRLDPIYAERYSDVWLWSDWPGRDGKGDTGIDLVARERDGTGYCAIQCKFYAPDHHLQKGDIDSFFTASGKHPFTSRIIISTTDKWGTNAEAALEKQQIPVARVGLADLAQAPIRWDLAWPSQHVELQLTRQRVKTLLPYQRAAVDDVLAGFAERDRGKLIMACGTGKTFTSLRIAERIAGQNGGSARTGNRIARDVVAVPDSEQQEPPDPEPPTEDELVALANVEEPSAPDADTLAQEFHEAMRDVYRRAKSEAGYTASYFQQSVEERGGVATARALLHAANTSEGFTQLYLRQRLDLAVEAVLYETPRFWPLFSEEEIEIARRRLDDHHYRPRTDR